MATKQGSGASTGLAEQDRLSANGRLFGRVEPSAPRHNTGSTPSDFVIELETMVIPRLMLAQRPPPNPKKGTTPLLLPISTASSRRQSRTLAHLSIDEDATAVINYINSLVSDQTPLDHVLCGTVAEAARYMGELWESDDLDFLDVTIGVSRLQQALRSITMGELPAVMPNDSAARRAAFVPASGEQHTFGLHIVCEAFRCRGWDVWGTHEIDSQELPKVVGTEQIDLVGFSLAAPEAIDQLAEQIAALRSASCSDRLAVIVGGDAFLKHPELWKSSGADAMASDALDAIRIAESLVVRECADAT